MGGGEGVIPLSADRSTNPCMLAAPGPLNVRVNGFTTGRVPSVTFHKEGAAPTAPPPGWRSTLPSICI